MIQVSLMDVASYLPGEPVAVGDRPDDGAEEAAGAAASGLYRHYVGAGETAGDMIERAVQPLRERHGDRAIREVDVLLVHTQLADLPFVSAGTEVVRRLGLRPEWLIDVQNSGCVAFVYMIKLAQQIIGSGKARTALICTVQNAAGRIFDEAEVRELAEEAMPGDGCGVGYLTASAQSPVLGVTCRHLGGTEIAEVRDDGKRALPEEVLAVCGSIGVTRDEIDVLITNQPSRALLRDWREALPVPAERHIDSFDACGNMFAAAVPVTLDRALRDGKIEDGSLLVLGGYAFAGDCVGAAAIRWRPPFDGR